MTCVQIYVYLALVLAVAAADQEACDKTKCPGPLEYYRLLDCKPVYEKEGDCCAIRYNCDHLNERNTKKCYVNDKEYNISEELREEDANLCDIKCFCKEDDDGFASFDCAYFDCYNDPAPGCFWRDNLQRCCGGEEVCLENLNERATCVVNGTTYKDGQHFKVKGEPDMNCVCRPGYEGENIEPFCIKLKRPSCWPYYYDAGEIYNKCAPVYDDYEPPQTSCQSDTRCQNSKDVVIHHHDNLKSGESTDEKNMCEFGNLKMHLGDELNQAADYSSICVKCVCEVPPVPTCQTLPSSVCDIDTYPFHKD